MPGFPLPLRNALAALAIDALERDDAAEALRWLHGDIPTPSGDAGALLAVHHLVDPGGGTLLAVHAPHADGVRAHAAHALAARAAYVRAAGTPAVERAVHRAVALWNVALFFEVHEVLEAVWKTAAGPTRQALQGVIQIAVAYHHLSHGNVRGARSLMSEGRERLRNVPPDTLAPLDVDLLLEATAAWDAIRSGDPPPAGAAPRLRLRVSA